MFSNLKITEKFHRFGGILELLLGTQCEGLHRLFPVFGVFNLKNNEEIPSIWRHFGAPLGDQKAKDYIVYFYVLSHKLHFLENPKMKRDI